jgi:hypothetical protein
MYASTRIPSVWHCCKLNQIPGGITARQIGHACVTDSTLHFAMHSLWKMWLQYNRRQARWSSSSKQMIQRADLPTELPLSWVKSAIEPNHLSPLHRPLSGGSLAVARSSFSSRWEGIKRMPSKRLSEFEVPVILFKITHRLVLMGIVMRSCWKWGIPQILRVRAPVPRWRFAGSGLYWADHVWRLIYYAS